jgi:hypothetical protein
MDKMNLPNLCPIPLGWAPYFMDFKTPYEALTMGKALIGTLETVAQRTRASPLLDWLRAACVWLGASIVNRRLSLVHQEFEATAPDARVVMWMQGKLAPYTLTAVTPAVVPQVGAPVLPGGTLPTPASEKEFSLLETSKIQGACGLTDAQWDTDLPEFYTRMLEEGRTTAQVKALLEDTFRPDDKYSLSTGHCRNGKGPQGTQLRILEQLVLRHLSSGDFTVRGDWRIDGNREQTQTPCRQIYPHQ